MERNPFSPAFADLPESIPVFPLTGVLLLPGGQLPLNIFEKRYLAMIEDAMATRHRLIGMIQPAETEQETGAPLLQQTGCAGKIVDFSETSDGRYLITLQGICRYDIAQELSAPTLYRQVKPDWGRYAHDLHKKDECAGLDRARLHDFLGQYFDCESLSCDWSKVVEAGDSSLITCLSMICPLGAQEKQALLEAPSCAARGQMFMTMLEMAIRQKDSICGTRH